MGKKIIILNGSPRPKGNTAALIAAFTQGAEQAGHTVATFLLDRMDIKGCKGCFGGGKNPDSPCVQKDDMEKLYPAFREADVVVMASPLYYWNMSGQLRIAFDRLFAVAELNAEYSIPNKSAVLLMAAGGSDFGLMQPYYEKLMKDMKWDNLGMVLAGGVNDIGDIECSPFLEEARKLGASIA